LWPELDQLCRQHRAVFIKVEPDTWEDEENRTALYTAGFRPGAYNIQPRRTLVLDITGDEEDILARMKQKTRYNIRLAERKGVRVSVTEDVETFSSLMQVTGERDAFGVHTRAYYQRAFQLFNPPGMCALFLADYQDQPLAGLMAFAHGKRAWYFYGASDNQYRNLMPTYLVQWGAIRWARAHGCATYDLWGVPDQNEEDLEARFSDCTDGLWGVYRFKRGFGGELKRASSAWDKIYNPLGYLVYRLLMARRGGE
jgi:lipid II:glycine glycyltransferase (peptidoglycan interpeptide bridge formation enzyme)